MQAQSALKYEVEVSENGHVEIAVPFPPGSRVTVFVVEETADSFGDLLAASQSSLDFWDNPHDNEFGLYCRS